MTAVVDDPGDHYADDLDLLLRSLMDWLDRIDERHLYTAPSDGALSVASILDQVVRILENCPMAVRDLGLNRSVDLEEPASDGQRIVWLNEYQRCSLSDICRELESARVTALSCFRNVENHGLMSTARRSQRATATATSIEVIEQFVLERVSHYTVQVRQTYERVVRTGGIERDAT